MCYSNRIAARGLATLVLVTGCLVAMLLCIAPVAAKKPPKPPPGGDGPTYDLVDLGVLGGGSYSYAVKVNNVGVVVGTSSIAGGYQHAFVVIPEDTDGDGEPDRWFRDSNGDGVNDLMIDLGTLDAGGTYSSATDLNGLCQVVGASKAWAYGQLVNHAFLWEDLDGDGESDPGEMRDLGTLHRAASSNAKSINNLGQVVGQSSCVHTPSHGGSHIYIINPKDTNSDGVPDLWFEDLDSDGVNELMVEVASGVNGGPDINDAGEIVCGSYLIRPEDTNGDGEPDRWFRDSNGDGVNDLLIALPPLSRGRAQKATAINASGVIAGESADRFKKLRIHAVRWIVDASGNATITDLGRQGGEQTRARDISSSGQVVGRPGFLWESGTMYDVLDLLSSSSGIDTLEPEGINDSGRIAATKNGTRACVLVPAE